MTCTIRYRTETVLLNGFVERGGTEQYFKNKINLCNIYNVNKILGAVRIYTEMETIKYNLLRFELQNVFSPTHSVSYSENIY